jgi:integrase
MAAVQERNGSYRVIFNYQRKQRAFTLGKVTRVEAEAKAAQVDYLLMRLGQGLISLPPATDIVAFVRNDGAIPDPDEANPSKNDTTLASLRDRYLATHSNGTLEAHTLRGINRHFRHLVRLLGENFPIRKLSLADLQDYVDKRSKAKGRRGTLNPTTIKKEIVTLRTTWNWGVRMKLVTGRYPNDGIRYPKSDEKPPFQTRVEIERQIPGLPPGKVAELWEALYLTLPEVEKLLAHVEERARHPWIYPLVAAAAYTGARKGELLRIRIADVDFAAGVVSIQEKKRAHGRRTTRRVPLSTALSSILIDWLKIHSYGPFLFAQAEEVERSKKRSRTTGHMWKDRPGEMRQRLGGVTVRERPGILPLTDDEAGDHLKRTLAGSQWAVVRGFHTLRHSFISACASKGIDQRLIDEFAGHSTEEQRRRYRHLYPSVQAEALKSVFG